MKKLILAPLTLAVFSFGFIACEYRGKDDSEMSESKAKGNDADLEKSIGEAQPRDVARKDYSESLASEERAKAKEFGEKVGNKLADAWIHAKIVSKLIGNSKTPERKITVDVVNNVVTLRGTVENREQKAEAERVAKETEGVKQVKNELKLAA